MVTRTLPETCINAWRSAFEPDFPLELRFETNLVGITGKAAAAIDQAGQDIEFFLFKHLLGDWGELPDELRRVNDQSLESGDRVCSRFSTLLGTTLFLITDGPRRRTAILTADESSDCQLARDEAAR